MNVKLRKNKQTGEIVLEYFKVPDKASFRYNTLKSIFEAESDVTIFIDTNQRKSVMPKINVEDFLQQSGITYSVFPVEANKTKYLGIPIDFSRKKKDEKLIVLRIASNQFTGELFAACIENFDIAVGLGGTEAFENTLKSKTISLDDILFNESFFERSIYDSIICASMRSSFDFTLHAGC